MTDNDKKTDDAPAGDEQIPEVEAEIVDDEAQASAAFDEGAAEESNGEPSPKKMGTLTPGVILFIAFAAIALILFVIWRLQPSGAEEGPSATEPSEQSETSTGSSESQALNSLGAGDIPAAQATPDLPDTDELASPDETSAAIDLGKIDNNAVAAMKEEAGAIDPTPAPPGGDVFLPPLPQEEQIPGGNTALQDAAKRALRQFGPGTGEADEAAPVSPDRSDSAGAASQPIEGFEVSPPDADASPENAQEDVEQQGAQAGAAGDLAFGEAVADEIGDAASSQAKISNDAEAIKEAARDEMAALAAALETEREENAVLRAEIEGLRHDMQSALEARNSETNAAISGLRADLDKIQNDRQIPAQRRGAGLAALADLKRAVGEGRSYAEELDVVAHHAPEAPAIAVLRKYAATGVAPAMELKKSFGAAAREGLAAAGREKATGVFSSLAARAQSLISIRPAKPQAGNSPRAIISRAEAAVLEDNFARALAQLEALPEPVAAAMDGWITGARGRVETAAAIESLNSVFLAPASK